MKKKLLKKAWDNTFHKANFWLTVTQKDDPMFEFFIEELERLEKEEQDKEIDLCPYC